MAARKNKKSKTPHDKKGLWQGLRTGESISLNYFRSNAWLMVTLVVVILALIGLRYRTMTKMVEINKLNKELARTQSIKLQEKASYMTLIRETEMKRLTQSKGLGLTFRDQPPMEIVRDK